MKVASIPLDFLVTDSNIREIGDTSELEKSMDVAGQAVEIRVVSLEDGNYSVIAGHRRVQAARNLGWSTIRAVVLEPYESEIERIIDQYNENSLREEMDYNTKAKIFSHIIRYQGISQSELAQMFSVSQAEVSLALAMERAHPKLKQAVAEERISPSAVEPLLALPEDEQEQLIDAAIKEKTVRKVRALVSAHKTRRNIVGTVTEIKEEPGIDPFDEMVLGELEKVDQLLDNLLVTEVSDKKIVRDKLHLLITKTSELYFTVDAMV